jgi:hypothetical protein
LIPHQRQVQRQKAAHCTRCCFEDSDAPRASMRHVHLAILVSALEHRLHAARWAPLD